MSNVKSMVSDNYLELMKSQHCHKTLRVYEDRQAFVTGAGKPKSIGEAIIHMLHQNKIMIEDNRWDLRQSTPKFHNKDLLVMCHGVSHLDWIEECHEEKMEEIIEVNLTASIRLVHHFVKETIEDEWRKQIILIGSMAYRSVLNGSAAYCASKAGLAHFARCAAWELAPKGYDVFIIHPSNTEGTAMTKETIQGLMRYRDMSRKEATAYWGSSLPRAKWLQPSNIADLVEFLISGKADYLSGTQIDMGGGQR